MTESWNNSEFWTKTFTGMATGVGIIVLVLVRDQFHIPGEKSAITLGQVPMVEQCANCVFPSLDTASPNILKFSLSLASPNDLKIRRGDMVEAGQIIANRLGERTRLTAERKALNFSLEKIQGSTIVTPLIPLAIPSVAKPPPISYAEEEAAIASTAVLVQQAQREFQLQQPRLKGKPLQESSAVASAQALFDKQQHLLDIQHRKIDAVTGMKDLPPDVLLHEQEVLKQEESDLVKANAELQQAQAKLEIGSNEQVDKLQRLAETVEKAQAEHKLAISKLQTARERRAYREYEYKVAQARHAEERNQALQNHQRQLEEAEQHQRDRSFQVAQIQAKISETDNKLISLSVVKSPYSGTIKRIRFTGQNDKNLSVEVILLVSRDHTVSDNPSPRTSHTTGTAVNSAARQAL